MSEPVVELFSDLHCPHAYVTRFRLQRVAETIPGEVRFRSRCLSLELAQENPTPKHILDVETPMLATLENDLPYQPWPEGKTSSWPVTFLPAFEAVKAAEALDDEKAWELDWRIRTAFFDEHRCVSMRHVLVELAREVGLEEASFVKELDSGRHKQTVIEESREGWHEEGFTHSPSFRFPDGSTVVNPGEHWTRFDPERNHRVVEFDSGRTDEAQHVAGLIQDAVDAA